MGRESTEQCESDGDRASALGSSELRLVLRGAPHWAEVSRPSNSLCLVIGWGMSRKKHGLTSNAAASPLSSAAGACQLIVLVVRWHVAS